MKLICQWLLIASTLASLLLNLKWDVEGRASKAPGGFTGVIGTVIAIALIFWVNLKAGSFSLIFGGGQ